MSTIYIKTYAGENLLATLVDETENTIVITNPLKIDTFATVGGMVTTIYPWVPIRELMTGNYTLDKDAMIGVMEIPEHVQANYDRIIDQTHSDNYRMPSLSDEMANESDTEDERITTTRILH